MFPIDTALLPSLATRKALLVVDAQNDFLTEDGALPIKMPMDLAQRISDLASNFRRNGGEIIWVQSHFESSRPLDGEQIMITDTPNLSPRTAPARGRRPGTAPPAAEPALSPEAFLTLDAGKGPACVRAGTPGAEMHPIIKQAVGPKDHTLTKTFYSAFKADQLVRLLRVRFVTELFICGSLTNVGVMATAIDAASYGYTITIVDDCCGLQKMSRHRTALRQIISTTGCDTLSAAKVLGMMKPRPDAPERADHNQRRGATGGRSPTVRVQRGRRDAVAPSASDIQSPLERLSLSGEPAAADQHAPTILTPPQQQQHQQQQQQQGRRPQPQPQSSSAVQSVARSSRPQRKDHPGRDPVAPRGKESSAANSRISAAPRQSDCGGIGGGNNEEAGADPLTEDSIASSDRRSQSCTPPHSATQPLLASRPNVNAGVNVDIHDNAKVPGNKERKKPKRIESPTSISNAGSPTSFEDEYEPLETPPTPVSTTPKDNPLPPLPLPPQSTATDLSSIRDGKSKKSSTMIPTQDAQQAESEPLCEGDTNVIYNILSEPQAQDIFERIRDEVCWQRMSHQGGEVPRLVAVQGCVEVDGSKPIYRHPADESPPLRPFTAAVDEIRRVVEARLGHPLNHVLIQQYRYGNDYISEHSDKTLDIARDSFIANLSVGAERTMTLRTKRQPKDGARDARGPDSAEGLKRQVQRARLPHNSLFRMGLATNMRWMHAIRPDKRLAAEKSDAERAYDGVRISLTFRRIATFLDAEEARIWGQGATAKTREAAGAVVNGQTAQAVAMLKAFGRENQATAFDWEAHYGAGFDVLHIKAAPRLFLSEDAVVNLRLRAMLGELGVSYAKGSLSNGDARGGGGGGAKTKGNAPEPGSAANVPVKFADNDEMKTVVSGQRDIMLYLQKTYGHRTNNEDDERRVRERFQEGLGFLDLWRSTAPSPSSSAPPPEEKEEDRGKGALNTEDMTKIGKLLGPWEEYAAENAFIAGPAPSVADYAFWPVLEDIFTSYSSLSSSTPFSSPTASSPRRRQEEVPNPDDTRENTDEGGKEEERGRDGNAALQFPSLRAYRERMRAREAIASVLG
ncbi:isochorismatase [Nemania serpens]|nr:isochorismatase [Nemania serpens]